MAIFEAFTGSAAKKAAAANKAEYEKYGTKAEGALNTAFNPSLEALNEGNEAWSSVANLGEKYGGATNLYEDALGVNGPEGNARGRAAYQAGPGFDENVTAAADRAAREAVSKGISLGGNATDAITRTTSNLYNNEWQKWLGHLQGFVNPELQATTSAAGGRAAGKGAIAGLYQNDAQNRTNVFGNVAGGIANSNTASANAQAQASSQFWSALASLGGNIAKAAVPGGGSVASSVGSKVGGWFS